MSQVFQFGPNNETNKPRYKDEQEKKKLTYNFVTSKQLKRGHNFGVVYFTPNSLEEELAGATVKKSTKKVAKSKHELEVEKREKLQSDVPQAVKGREHVACGTDPVTSTIRPKPLTFEIEAQTDDYLDRPVSPLNYPIYNNPEVSTQIEDGDLFHFDDEVAPILNVLVTKILEQSRMEVLEEEEITEIKKKQRYFEELRNRELMDVQKLEDAETRRKEEINRRQIQQKERMDLTKIHQKKLISRVFAREYLINLKTNTLTNLISSGVFQKPLSREIYFEIAPYIQKKAEIQINNSLKYVNNLHNIFRSQYHKNASLAHKESLQKEVKRKADEEKRKKEEIKYKAEMKLKKQQEKERREKEEIKMKLYNEINEEFMKNTEMVSDIIDILDPQGNGLIGRKFSSLSGGIIGQWALVMTFVNSINPDDPFINLDKLNKSIEIFLPKFPATVITVDAEDLEFFKSKDANIQSPDDLVKVDDNLFVLF